MQKPKNISEYTVIEQQAIIDELEKNRGYAVR